VSKETHYSVKREGSTTSLGQIGGQVFSGVEKSVKRDLLRSKRNLLRSKRDLLTWSSEDSLSSFSCADCSPALSANEPFFRSSTCVSVCLSVF